jgi:hypothetical protein
VIINTDHAKVQVEGNCGYSPLKLGCLQVRLEMQEMTLEQVFLRISSVFLCSSSFPHFSIHINHRSLNSVIALDRAYIIASSVSKVGDYKGFNYVRNLFHRHHPTVFSCNGTGRLRIVFFNVTLK